MKRKSIIFIAVLCALTSVAANAQELEAPEGYEYVDSLVYHYQVDTVHVGDDIFLDMPSRNCGDSGTVNVQQSELLETSMRQHIRKNGSRTHHGYRVRIFFDNKQSARVESEAVLKRFEALHRDIKAYRTYANPYFKVTVGDFRTKSEAMEVLSRIKTEFPSAFVVKESIEYPIVDRTNVYVVETVKVLRPINIEL
jgi:hypothetical protein